MKQKTQHKGKSLIHSAEIFSDMDGYETDILYSRMDSAEYPAGTVLFREGDEGDSMFVIICGSVSISVSLPDGQELRLARLEAGSFFGEMALIENEPRSATCTTLTDSTLLSLSQEKLETLVREYPEIAVKIFYRMLRITTGRLSDTGAVAADMVQWGEKARLRAITDDFTGLFNRRFLDEAFTREFQNAKRDGTPLSVVMVDLDRFGNINKKYGEPFGDSVILAASRIFKESFSETDILSRYGGDEFTFLLPGSDSAAAIDMCAAACEKLRKYRFPEHPDFILSASMGVASLREHAFTQKKLRETADAALYQAKENGRDCVMPFRKPVRLKTNFKTIAERNKTVERIISAVAASDEILLAGHILPDEDCIASLVAAGLLLTKFDKTVSIYIRDTIQDNLSYLFDICTYNNIKIYTGSVPGNFTVNTIGILDTPKTDMVDVPERVWELTESDTVRKIEIDHHLASDASYTGDEGYRLVFPASSTCEILAFLCYKLTRKQGLLTRYHIPELYSRNLVLSLLTGIIGDSKLGSTAKTRRDIAFYKYFSRKLADILRTKTRENTGNYSNLDQIYQVIRAFSTEEDELYTQMLTYARETEHIGYVIFNEAESAHIMEGVEYSVFVNVIKAMTDYQAETSRILGITAYYDKPDVSNLIQFRVRCASSFTDFDLRPMLQDLSIENGGGHAGAVGFRTEKKTPEEFKLFVCTVLDYLEKRIALHLKTPAAAGREKGI